MKMKVAAFQIDISENKEANLNKLEAFIHQLREDKIDLVVLPEMFICPYQTHLFTAYAEVEGGETWSRLSEIARKYDLYIVAGSVPENDQGNIYNTAYVFNPKGQQIAKHRKVHLFDIDVENGQVFKESDVLSAGSHVTVFDTEFGKIGLCICYDIRFPELSRLMVNQGAKMIIVPAAFNMTTGPSHWEILFRTRALDNQVYTLGAAPARNTQTGYTSWGHSILVSPWGEVIKQLGDGESSMIVEIDLNYVEKIRRELPMLKHRRRDMYNL